MPALYLISVLVLAGTPGWSPAGSLSAARSEHTSTLLLNGKVLVTGGGSTSAELLDPATNIWSSAASMSTPRGAHTATLLPNGKVLVVGGSGFLASAELYDPATNNWSAARSLVTGRAMHTATLLKTGRVLVVGGVGSGNVALIASELYDPGSDTWTSGGTLSVGRYQHAATLIGDGSVVVCGGLIDSTTVTQSTERYSVAGNTWSVTHLMGIGRRGHTAVLDPFTGYIFAMGGDNGTTATASVEIYNVLTDAWSPSGALSTARAFHTATVLPNNSAIVIGGNNSGTVSTVETYLLLGGITSPGVSMPRPRQNHTATLLPSGEILVTAGFDSGTSSNTAATDVYNADTSRWTAATSMTTARQMHTATYLPSIGKVLLVTGYNGSTAMSSVESYDPVSNTWNSPAPPAMPAALQNQTATLLQSGQVLIAGGRDGVFLPQATSFEYSPGLNSLAPVGSLANARHAHTATLLPNGKVLVTGGFTPGPGYVATCELYDPGTQTWSGAASMTTVRAFHTATLMRDGRVLVAGGYNTTDGYLSSLELYDSRFNTWTSGGNMSAARLNHAAAPLPNGKVLILGGENSVSSLSSADVCDGLGCVGVASMSGVRANPVAVTLPSGRVLVSGGVGASGHLATTEIYQPTLNVWYPGASMAVPRVFHTATVLPTGLVFIAGGFNSAGTGPSGTLDSAEIYDDTRGASFWRPVLSSVPSPMQAGGSYTIGGSGLRGFSHAGGGSNESATDYPIGFLQSLESGQVWSLSATSFTDTSMGVTVPPGVLPGHYLVGALVNAIPGASTLTISAPPPPTLSPSTANVFPSDIVNFAASGGTGVGYVTSYVTNNSGGTLDGSGHYRAGTVTGVNDVVMVVDSLGLSGTAIVTVNAPVPPADGGIPDGGTGPNDAGVSVVAYGYQVSCGCHTADPIGPWSSVLAWLGLVWGRRQRAARLGRFHPDASLARWQIPSARRAQEERAAEAYRAVRRAAQ